MNEPLESKDEGCGALELTYTRLVQNLIRELYAAMKAGEISAAEHETDELDTTIRVQVVLFKKKIHFELTKETVLQG